MSNTIIYILSISLQVAGALLLLVYASSIKRENVIKSFSGKGIIHRDENTMEISYNEDAFKEVYKTVFLNKCAFAFIALGYFFGVFGAIEWESKLLVGIIIVALVLIIIVATLFVANQFILHSKEVNKKITNGELERLGIEPDMCNISNQTIKSLFK